MSDQRTLAVRLTEGRIPVSEALHYAMSLADALRKLHVAGKAHGALTPASVELTGSGVDLVPSLGPQATVTPYTAPEVIQGQPADSRSDVFSFGALVFEMLTGRPAFDGESQTELKLALCNSAPPPSGSPAVDRLVTSCVAKSPAARWQRMQKIIMELKLLSVAARRADNHPGAARAVADSELRAEMQQVEARIAARLATYEKSIEDMRKSAGDTQKSAGEAVESLKEQLAGAGAAVECLKEQLAGLHAQLAAVQERPVVQPVDIEALTEQIHGRLQQSIDAVTEQLRAQVMEAVGTSSQEQGAQMQAAIDASAKQISEQANETRAAANHRMAAAEQNMEEIRKHFATLQSNVAGDLHDFEKSLKSQGVAIESARTAMAQTDDLVERVVEALELLQSSMLDHEPTGVN